MRHANSKRAHARQKRSCSILVAGKTPWNYCLSSACLRPVLLHRRSWPINASRVRTSAIRLHLAKRRPRLQNNGPPRPRHRLTMPGRGAYTTPRSKAKRIQPISVHLRAAHEPDRVRESPSARPGAITPAYPQDNTVRPFLARSASIARTTCCDHSTNGSIKRASECRVAAAGGGSAWIAALHPSFACRIAEAVNR